MGWATRRAGRGRLLRQGLRQPRRAALQEDFALQPRFPYDVSKAATDLIARSYAATYGLPVAVTRLANVYGGGDFNLSRIVPDTVRALIAGERPVIRSDGTPERDYIYAEDAVAAYLAVAARSSAEELHGRAWNAGAGSRVPVLELVDKLIAVSGTDLEPDIQGEGTPHGEIDRQYLDSTAISEDLGWTPGPRRRAGRDLGLVRAPPRLRHYRPGLRTHTVVYPGRCRTTSLPSGSFSAQVLVDEF